MASGENTIQIRWDMTTLSEGLRGAAIAIEGLGRSAERVANATRHFNEILETKWAEWPGEWPDEFVLLNRYLRTGVKPPYLVNQ